jgi:hypothetical protein
VIVFTRSVARCTHPLRTPYMFKNSEISTQHNRPLPFNVFVPVSSKMGSCLTSIVQGSLTMNPFSERSSETDQDTWLTVFKPISKISGVFRENELRAGIESRPRVWTTFQILTVSQGYSLFHSVRSNLPLCPWSGVVLAFSRPGCLVIVQSISLRDCEEIRELRWIHFRSRANSVARQGLNVARGNYGHFWARKGKLWTVNRFVSSRFSLPHIKNGPCTERGPRWFRGRQIVGPISP